MRVPRKIALSSHNPALWSAVSKSGGGLSVAAKVIPGRHDLFGSARSRWGGEGRAFAPQLPKMATEKGFPAAFSRAALHSARFWLPDRPLRSTAPRFESRLRTGRIGRERVYAVRWFSALGECGRRHALHRFAPIPASLHSFLYRRLRSAVRYHGSRQSPFASKGDSHGRREEHRRPGNKRRAERRIAERNERRFEIHNHYVMWAIKCLNWECGAVDAPILPIGQFPERKCTSCGGTNVDVTPPLPLGALHAVESLLDGDGALRAAPCPSRASAFMRILSRAGFARGGTGFDRAGYRMRFRACALSAACGRRLRS